MQDFAVILIVLCTYDDFLLIGRYQRISAGNLFCDIRNKSHKLLLDLISLGCLKVIRHNAVETSGVPELFVLMIQVCYEHTFILKLLSSDKVIGICIHSCHNFLIKTYKSLF